MPHLVQKLCPRIVLAAIASLLIVLAGGLPATAADTAGISGRITAPVGVDLASTWISVYTAEGFNYAGSTYADNAGNYELPYLPAGSFKLSFSNPDTIDQWFENASSSETATPVTVTAGGVPAVANATLVKGASISGKVTAPAGVDLNQTIVLAYKDGTLDGSEGTSWVNGDGTYSIGGLAAGSYKLQFYGYDSGGLEQWYPNAPSHETATFLTVASGQAISGINATLVKGATISGKVTAPPGVDLAQVTVYAGLADGSGNGTPIAADGTYKILGLAAGSYKLEFNAGDSGALNQWYNNATYDTATPVTVTSGQDLGDINATLVKGASISGKLTAPAGVDLSNVRVYANASNGFGSASVNPDGTYKITALPAGSYKVEFNGRAAGAQAQWYSNAQTSDAATPITLASGQDLGNINATLIKGATISGKATVPAGINPTQIWAILYQAGTDRAYADSAPLASDGTYSFKGLSAGSYKLNFATYISGAVDQWYANRASFETADPITLTTSQELSGINVTLLKGATVSGKVTAPAGTNLDQSAVKIFKSDSSSKPAFTASVSADGNFKAVGIPTGTYKILFDGGASGATDQWFGGTTFAAASTVALTAGTDRTGVNFTTQTGGAISGKVSGPASYYPVSVLDTSGAVIRNTYSSNDGSYNIKGLTSGTYKIAFNRSSGFTTEEAQFYQNKPESAGLAQATGIPVTLGQTTPNIGATLGTGAKISGTILDKSGKPLPNALVQAYTLDGSLVTRSTDTDASGKYTLSGATTGKYIVKVTPNGTTLGNLYSGNVTSEANAALVTTTSGTTATLNLSYAAGATLTAPVPTISGTAKVGLTLTANPGTWGPAPVTLAYQWKANGTAISGATAATYKAAAADLGKTITLTVTGTKAGYATAAKTSAATAAVAAGTLTTAVPTITGTVAVGQTLTAKPGTWGPAPVNLYYQWKANGTAISGATTAAYKPVSADVGKTLTVTVTGRKTGYTTAAKTSTATTTVKATAPALTAPVPTISGTAKVGLTLTANPGTWGPAPVTLAYQWKANGTAISGATAATYKAAAADLGKTITLTVTGTKAGYATAAKTSAATAAVAAGTLTTAVPTITGTVAVGQTLTANPGTWGPAPVNLYYQWKANGTAISGATTATYKPVSADVGKTLTVTVTGRKTGYTTAAKTSTATTVK